MIPAENAGAMIGLFGLISILVVAFLGFLGHLLIKLALP